jgi:hypothetical protein
MPYHALMRWENEGGAVVTEGEGDDPRVRSQPKRSSQRQRDRSARRAVQADDSLGDRRPLGRRAAG